jgi:hypothetical protein
VQAFAIREIPSPVVTSFCLLVDCSCVRSESVQLLPLICARHVHSEIGFNDKVTSMCISSGGRGTQEGYQAHDTRSALQIYLYIPVAVAC